MKGGFHFGGSIEDGTGRLLAQLPGTDQLRHIGLKAVQVLGGPAPVSVCRCGPDSCNLGSKDGRGLWADVGLLSTTQQECGEDYQ